MFRRAISIALFFAVLPLFAACSSSQATPMESATPTPEPSYLTEEIPPCTSAPGSSVDPCEPGVAQFEEGAALSLPDIGDEPWSIREMLGGGGASAYVIHLALRGAYLPDTARCTAGDRFRAPSYLQEEFYTVAIKCYIDVRVGAYILGDGPSTLTVYRLGAIYGDDTEQDVIEEMRQAFETSIDGWFPGREEVLFLGPAPDLSSEVWQVMGVWDVQRREDGMVVAVHPDRDLWKDLRPDEYRTLSSRDGAARLHASGDRSESGPSRRKRRTHRPSHRPAHASQ